MLDWISVPNAWIGLVTLTVLEIVLGMDNVIFISILSGKLNTPPERERARKLGLGLALVSRVLLVLSVGWVTRLTFPIFHVPFGALSPEGQEVSWRDLILLVGGLFLVWKAGKEIHAKLEGEEGHGEATVAPKLSAILVQILLLDVVFSLDSVITAVGMVQQVGIMIAAVVIAVGFMMFFSGQIAGFVERHPTVKMLALSFLILIGVSLVAESFDQGIPKGYIYFAMAFSVAVEMLNLRVRKGRKPPEPVHLHEQTP
jgi:predicted tellurium resistance membrane protein TerC